ncbi:MAG: hypothetical protein KAS32_26800, partial [Candidatus Peribacteraceae bacterium]|nr:hypothetical protein [Candidatus Peribacteraceae bacterium]
MKYILVSLLLIVMIPVLSLANIVNNSGSTAADSMSIAFVPLDTLGEPTTLTTSDSLYLVTYYPNGSVAFRDTVLANVAAIDTVKFSGDIYYNWNLAVADIDGSGKDGVYSYTLTIIDNTLNLTTAYRGTFQVYQSYDYNIWADRLTDSLQAVIDSLQRVLTDGFVLAGGQFTKISDTTWNRTVRQITGISSTINANIVSVDAGAIEQGDIEAGGISSVEMATDAIGASEIAAGAITVSEMPALANLDSTKYGGRFGAGIWLDRNSGITGTTVGTHGTQNNPVDNFTSARTLADALGIKRYYINGRSQFTGANDLDVTHEEWEISGEGEGVAVEINADVDGSIFTDLIISGTQGGSGDIELRLCSIGDFAGADGKFLACGLLGTITIGSSDDLFMHLCYSEVAGNNTPSVSFGAGISNVVMRAYSGGVTIVNMSSNDNASIETDGQVIADPTCTGAPITVRGMASLTPDTANTYATFTKDAVFSRKESDLWVWSNIDTTNTIDTSDVGDWFRNNIASAPGSVTPGNMSDIADTIFARDSTDINTLGTNESFGQLMVKPAYVQGAAASGVDSLTLSNVLYRVIYGISKAPGSDSTTLAQRKITVAGIVNDIITAAAIATDAIGSAELASTAAQEIADTTVNDSLDYQSKEVTDTLAIKTMLLNNLFARLSQDTVIEITVGGNIVIASINEDGDTIARFKDSISFQGEAGSLTVQSIVDGVFDESQSAHTIPGTFGKYIDTEISGVSSPSGSGAYTISWILLDTTATPDSVVPQAMMWVNNVAQSASPLRDRTDNNGLAQF